MALAEKKKKKKTQDVSKTSSEQPPKKEKSEEQKQKPDEDPKKSDDTKKQVPEIVMRVYMHCEGCARKIRRCLIGFDGVEEVMTDCKTHEVVVKGENADPLKVVDRVQKKTHRQVELLSAIPKPQSEEEKKDVEEKKDENPKPEDKKEGSKVVTVVLKIHMHCEPCSLGLKRKIEKMKGVEEAIPDLKSSTVSVKSTLEPPQLVDYVYKRTGKHAIIVKIDPPLEKEKEGDKGKDGKDENKGGDEGKGDKKEEGVGGGGSAEGKAAKAVAPPPVVASNAVEMRKNEYYYQPYYNHGMDVYAYEYQPPPPPPQIFSDENPNACSIM